MKHAHSVTYDKQADALYIRLREGESARADPYTDDLVIHLDGAGRPVGIEILDLTATDPTADLGRVTAQYNLGSELLDVVSQVRKLAQEATERVVVA